MVGMARKRSVGKKARRPLGGLQLDSTATEGTTWAELLMMMRRSEDGTKTGIETLVLRGTSRAKSRNFIVARRKRQTR